jgi:hypothetical protein
MLKETAGSKALEEGPSASLAAIPFILNLQKWKN